jgi:choline dehydrogenase-like flavoprotein
MTGAHVVVIGSGPCGAMAATELLRGGVHVTMLDAGARPARGILVRARGKTLARWVEPDKMRTDRHRAGGDPHTEWYSSMTSGGLSNYWTSAVPRFAPEDFTDGAALGQEYQWPIGYDDLDPFYQRAERALVVTAGSGFPNVPDNVPTYRARLPADWQELCGRARAAGQGMGPMPMANGAPTMVALRSTGFNSFHCIIKPLLRTGSLRLIRSARARRIRWRAGDGRADAVEYVDSSTGETKVIEADAVVVAAGALDSTAILLRSKSSDFPNGLGDVEGVLGRYLHDHPRQWWAADLSVPLTALTHPVYISRAPHDESPALRGVSMTIGLANNTAERLRALAGAKTTTVGVQLFGTMVPRHHMTVKLDAADDDRLDAPLWITTQYESEAMEDLVAARERFARIFGSFGIEAKPRAPFHELHPGSSVHWGGTIRMHTSPKLGMLDARNRLHAVPNVVVCDSSCFPTGPEKNPTLTAMALAGRAAHLLAEDLNR